MKLADLVVSECRGCQATTGQGIKVPETGAVRMPVSKFASIGIDLWSAKVDDSIPRVDREAREAKVLTVACRLTGFTKFSILKKTDADSVTRAVLRVLYDLGVVGAVLEIVTDNGLQFTSRQFEALKEILPGLELRKIPSYSPWLGGFYEIHHRDLLRAVQAEIVRRPLAEWKDLVTVAAFKINSHKPMQIYPSPFALIHGEEPKQRSDRIADVVLRNYADSNSQPFTPAELRNWLEEKKRTLAEFESFCEDQFRNSRLEKVLKQKREKDRTLLPGDLVDVRVHGGNKISVKWEGPYKLMESFQATAKIQGFDQLKSWSDIKPHRAAKFWELDRKPRERWNSKLNDDEDESDSDLDTDSEEAVAKAIGAEPATPVKSKRSGAEEVSPELVAAAQPQVVGKAVSFGENQVEFFDTREEPSAVRSSMRTQKRPLNPDFIYPSPAIKRRKGKEGGAY